jgi:multicomponent Na+:H+ antiporter subunit D
MMIGIGLFTPDGLAGAAVYVLGHGMVKAGLFLVAGILLHRFESVDEDDLCAKGRGQPWTAAVFLAGGIGLAGFPFSGLSAGSELMNASARAAGFHWVFWIFLGTSSLTSAAVLRAGGRTFFGWGPSVSRDGAPRHEEKPETKAGHFHTPASMFLPAAVLVAAGLLVGLTPGLIRSVRSSAALFEDSSAYAARVLDARPEPEPRPRRPAPDADAAGLVSAMAAILIAGAHLFSPRTRRISAFLAKPAGFLHRIHSGHPGDYVAFLTFGMACFGLICLYIFP